MPNPLCHFEYLYRDASNYKGRDSVLLAGEATPANEAAIRAHLIDRMYFVAEHVGVPTLYHLVWGDTGPDDAEDHEWHEFVGLIPADTGEQQPVMTVAELLIRLNSRPGANAAGAVI